jgi:uncharacterized membrane protein YgcG
MSTNLMEYYFFPNIWWIIFFFPSLINQKQIIMTDYKCIVSFYTDAGAYFGYGSIIDHNRYLGLTPKDRKNFIENESYISSSNSFRSDDGYTPPSIDFSSDSNSSSSWDSGSSSSDSSSFDFGGGDTGGGGASGDW